MFKFYNTLTFDESLDHKHSDWSPDNIYSYRQWYEEDIQGKDTLLVMIGDSWTWGDHLGTIDWDNASNDPCRMEEIAGRKLANLLNADWVNLARPGCSNYWMLEKLYDIQPFLEQNNYKKIHVVITLTEDLRESTYSRRINVDSPYQQFWTLSNNIQDFLVKVETFLFDNLQEYFNRLPAVTFTVSRAFTDSWTQRHWLLDKTWCDIIQDNISFSDYQKPVPFIGQMSIDPLTEKFIAQNIERKSEFLDIMERVGTRWQFLGNSVYNLKGSTCHPNPAGHTLWAEYLYSQLR